MAGYSGTPLGKKLGIKPGSRILALRAPSNYAGLIAPLPEGAALESRISERTDIVHVFSTKRKELAPVLGMLRKKLKDDGAIWVSWPKKSARMPTDITEDTVREIALPLGLVDIKVCAVDAVWSGLKLVVRREHRTTCS
jgi:Protein of unknown function (DUF3052)